MPTVKQQRRKIKQVIQTVKASRTGEGLRDLLFDEIDALRDGTGNASRAIAVAKLACQIINTVKVEVEYQHHVKALAANGQSIQPGETMRLGTPSP